MIYLGEAFNGKATKKARSHGKKFQVSIQQETSRILVWVTTALATPTVDNLFTNEILSYIQLTEIFPGMHDRATLAGLTCSRTTMKPPNWCTARHKLLSLMPTGRATLGYA
jgi:hypothetical protein